MCKNLIPMLILQALIKYIFWIFVKLISMTYPKFSIILFF